MGEFSFVLQSDGSTKLNSTLSSHPCEGPKQEFSEEAAHRIKTLFQNEIQKRIELNKQSN